MNDQALVELRAFVSEAASAEKREELLGVLDAALTAIGAQALTIRGLAARLRSAQVGLAQMDAAVPRELLGEVAGALGRPGARGVSIQEAEAAARDLARQAARGSDAAAVLVALARVVRVFA